MQKLVNKQRSFIHQFLVKRTTRSFSFSSSINDPASIVIEESNANSKTLILNRPSVLNALTTPMMNRIHNLYERWEDDPNVGFVIMKGNGNAFCSGADIISVRDMIVKGNIEGSKEFFRMVYSFAYFLSTFLKPNVAILDGITMGGGAGISIPGTFRIVTDKTVYSTPETLIGLHPDAGASFHLSHLPGYVGEYLGLTGDRLNGVEMLACGLGTHHSHATNVPEIEESLASLITDDPSVIETSLKKYSDFSYPDKSSDFSYPDKSSVIQRMETIDKCFSHDSVEEIIDALETGSAKTHDAWYDSTLKKLKYASPLSLKLSLRSIREGRFQTIDQCLKREYRLTSRAVSCQISSNNFCEGVRARMVDKDFAPKWDPPSLEHVSQDMVDAYFSPISVSEHELELPTKQREAFL
ncbi:3-hydroxyisobutyryl-CoA hydrolase-like protein 1, mitochondrial isoform X2 [Rutidosis leptorrhynchoides]|uniref:3-hydroxyisobutyryl-CoA hydrolase-like protein 1, mitochondrial isoform X2 n=1 Tax=Rutidosis leptorrhynchoides TaxID=125765 RepID=UPI003A9A396C